MGPGTELKEILAGIGLHARPASCCDCDGLARRMDEWGPGRCREKLSLILQHLRGRQISYGWTERLIAVGMAGVTGLAFDLGVQNWLDPFPAIVELAIRRGEEKQS